MESQLEKYKVFIVHIYYAIVLRNYCLQTELQKGPKVCLENHACSSFHAGSMMTSLFRWLFAFCAVFNVFIISGSYNSQHEFILPRCMMGWGKDDWWFFMTARFKTLSTHFRM